MDNKTKVKVAVVIGIVVLAVIFIFMVIFVKGNKTPVNKNIPTKGQEGYVDPTKTSSSNKEEKESPGEAITLDDVISLGIENGNLVKINKDLSSEVVKKLESGHVEYCYGDSKVYSAIDNEDGSYSIIEIDLLKSNYPEKTILTSSNYETINNLSYYAGKLYFISGKDSLIEYSISENYSKALTNEGEASSFVIDKENNIMYVSYKPNGQNPGIYILDFTTNSFTQIISLGELAGELILSGKTLVIDVKEFSMLYVYHIEQNTVVAIGSDNYLPEVNNLIAFYDNVLLYTDGATINIKDENGNSYQDNWYTLNDRTIADISMIDKTKLQIARYDVNGASSGNVSRSIIIDLSNGATTEMPDTAYTDLIRIK